MRWLSAVTVRSSRSRGQLAPARLPCPPAPCSASCNAVVLTASSSSVARSWSLQRLLARLQREDAGRLLAELDLEPVDRRRSSCRARRAGSWSCALSCSTLISRRRVDIANSARSWSLSAWISAIDSGVAASSRRMRQAHGARMDQRNDDEPEQARDQEADAEIHDRLDHEETPPARRTPRRFRGHCACASVSIFGSSPVNIRRSPQRHGREDRARSAAG